MIMKSTGYSRIKNASTIQSRTPLADKNGSKLVINECRSFKGPSDQRQNGSKKEFFLFLSFCFESLFFDKVTSFGLII